MKTLKVNRLEQAMKELKAIKGITEETIESVKTEIKPRERKLYHVALVKKHNNQAKEEYVTTVVVQSYNDRSFPNLKKNLVYLGINQAIVLHDPKLEDFTNEPTSTFETRKENLETIAEMKAKHEKEMADLRKELTSKPTENVVADENAGDGGTATVFDAEKAVKADLIAYAAENEIDLGEATLVDDIRKVVIAGITANDLKA